MSSPEPVVLGGRFSRLEAIEWWEQARLGSARILVVGAGALGNEVVKNLSLLGIGRMVVVDRDVVERSNLSRSVLFRESDEGEAKASCAARAARDLFPALKVEALTTDVLSGVGLGLFRWADVVVGAVDNREARVFLNAACARVGTPWIDGGIEVLQGIVRGFAPPDTACYECTMTQVDWDLVNQSRSCALVARRAATGRGTPTTPTSASVIGAIQAQEVVKSLHGLEALMGQGWVFEGARHSSYAVRYPVKPDCPWHEPQPFIEDADQLGLASPLEAVWELGVSRLGGLDAIDLPREIVASVACQRCGSRERVLLPLERLDERTVSCPACGEARTPALVHSLAPGHELLSLTVGGIGLPPWDVVWVRRGQVSLGLELSAERAAVLGAAA